MPVWKRFLTFAGRHERKTQALLAGSIAATGDLICQCLEISHDASKRLEAESRAQKQPPPLEIKMQATESPLEVVTVNGAIRAEASSATPASTTSTNEKSTVGKKAYLPMHDGTMRGRVRWYLSQVDTVRLGAVSMYGFCIAGPLGAWWYPWIDKLMLTRFPHFLPGTFKFVATKTMAEQLIMGPICTASFFPCVSIVEGGDSWRTLKERMRRDFLNTLIADEIAWFCMAPITYKFVPVQWQLIFTSIVSVVENMGFSWVQHQGFPEIPYLGIEGVASVGHTEHNPPATFSTSTSTSTVVSADVPGVVAGKIGPETVVALAEASMPTSASTSTSSPSAAVFEGKKSK